MRTLTIAIAISLALAACKDDKGRAGPGQGTQAPPGATPSETPGGTSSAGTPASATPEAPATAPGASGGGSCDITVEGAVTLKESAPPGPTSVGTDYWTTEEEIRRGLSLYEKDKAKVEKEMKADPRIATLILNCNTGARVHVALTTGGKYADIPFGPKKYEIGGDAPSSFAAITSVDKQYYKAKSGTLDVTRFDDTGVAATFEFEAIKHGAAGDSIKVSGKLDFPCPPTYSKCKR